MKSMENKKKLSQHVWEAMHTKFPIAYTSAIVSQLTTGEEGEVLEPGTFRWVEIQYLGPHKVKDIEDSNCEI